MPAGKHLSREEIETIQSAILSQPDAPQAELAAALGVSERTITNQRQAIGAPGTPGPRRPRDPDRVSAIRSAIGTTAEIAKRFSCSLAYVRRVRAIPISDGEEK